MKHNPTEQADFWFTIEQIDDTSFAISEYGHWEQVHSYLLLGDTKACLIDTGLGIGNIRQVVDDLTRLPVFVVTTHVHWDHIGGHGFFQERYVHREDAKWLRKGIPLTIDQIRRDLMREPLTKSAPADFDLNRYRPFQGEPTSELEDGEIIDLGGREVMVLHTPGHSPGHCCFLDRTRGYLCTGDLIYEGTLYAFYPSTDPVAFCASVEKINGFDGIRKVLPGHNLLNVGLDLVATVNSGFQQLKSMGVLYHGAGTYDFGDVKVKL